VVFIFCFPQVAAATPRPAHSLPQKDFSGSEEQNLSDLVVKQLDAQVLPDVFGKIESEIPAGKMRSMAHDKVYSTIDTVGPSTCLPVVVFFLAEVFSF
jgi:hypothetical protein